jgi:hypothetical protein
MSIKYLPTPKPADKHDRQGPVGASDTGEEHSDGSETGCRQKKEYCILPPFQSAKPEKRIAPMAQPR